MTEMRLWLVSRSDIATPVGEITEGFGAQFQEQLQGLGSGEVIVGNEDPILDLFPPDALIRFDLDGAPAFLLLVEEVESALIALGEERDQVTRIAGRSHLAVLEQAVIYPARGVGRKPASDDRLFSWASPAYDDSGWTQTAVSITSVAGALVGGPYYRDADGLGWDNPFALNGGGFGEGWPEWDDWTQVIWSADGSVHWAPTGDIYLRHTFTLAQDLTNAQLWLVIDNGGEVYIDGQEILTTEEFMSADSVRLDISAGQHTVAVHAYNGPGGATNPAGVGLALFAADSSGVLIEQEPVFVSSPEWKVLPYPAEPPGMTPGEVIRIAVTEAQARGAIPEVTLGFSDQVDSKGNLWAGRSAISTQVGTDLATFLVDEMASTWVDLWMPPNGFTLFAFNIGTRGLTRPANLHGATDPTDQTSGNLTGLTTHQIR